MSNNKWANLIAFACQLRDEARKDGRELSLRDLAEQTKLFFDLSQTESQIYQILYRLLPDEKPEDKQAYLSDLAKRIGTREDVHEGGIPRIFTGEGRDPLVSPAPTFQHKVVNPLTYDTPGMYVVIGCAHAPAHNKELFKRIQGLIAAKSSEIAGLALIGDIIDCNALSEYGKGKFTPVPGLTLEEEYDAGKELVESLTADLKGHAHKIYLYGNHEDRYNRYMSDMENSKRALPSPEIGMGLDKMDFRVYKRWSHDYITLGKHLDLLHGQFFNVHCAKKHIDNYRGSVMFAHTHRIQTYIEGEVGGFNIGWTGDINSPFFDYMPRGTKKMWQNGFAIVNIDEKGHYHVEQIIAHNNRFYYGGKQY
jgi:hypothetical protein